MTGIRIQIIPNIHSSFKSFRNAIQVKNISRVQVGHLPRNVASKLAPLLDRRVVTVEGVINDGNRKNQASFCLLSPFLM